MMDKTLFEARRKYDLGFAIIWLRPRSKIPWEAGWTTGPRSDWAYLEKTYRPGNNVGVRLGTPSKIGEKYLAVIDVDVKSTNPKHKKEAYDALHKIIGTQRLPTVSSGRGNGSAHLYCLTRVPFKTFNPATSEERVKYLSPSKKPSREELNVLTKKEIAEGYRLSKAWEISLYSDGRQVVLPPSIHPDSGKSYVWETPFKNPLTLDFGGAERSVRSVQKKNGAVSQPRMESGPRRERLSDFVATSVQLDFLDVPKDIVLLIKKGIWAGREVDQSDYMPMAISALLSADCDRNDVLTILTDTDYALGRASYRHAGETRNRETAANWAWHYGSVKKAMDARDPKRIFSTPFDEELLSGEELQAQSDSFAEDIPWQSKLGRTKNGTVNLTLKNLDLILSNQVPGKVFIRDLFANRDSYGIDTPWGGKAGTALTDIDLIKIRRWLSDTSFNIEPKKELTLDALNLIADRNGTHPVQEYLSSLIWDGRPRISTWIRDYLQGEAEEPYLSQVSQLFLIALCKRVFQPGCQWDYILVLEGNQGTYKSSTARALAGDRWFMDNLPDLRDKDSMLNLQGKWLIELGELASTKRADYDSVKAYLSRRVDTVRSPYGMLQRDIPRQSSFIGSVNEGQYLKDPTGNRRFWPVKVGLCDAEGIAKIRDQLFAEAMHVYTQNKDIKLMLGAEANEQAGEAQDARRIDDDVTGMTDALLRFMESEKLKNGSGFDFNRFRQDDLFRGVSVPWGKWAEKNYATQTGAQVLSNLGFERRKVRGQRIWGRATRKIADFH
jgi:predicted P-loop ATPase